MDISNANSSDFKSAAWKARQNEWKLLNDLWQSPMYVRERREEFLEKFRKEPDIKYGERLNRSVFTNKLRDTIETFAGMALKQDPSPKEAPEPIAELFTDIDGLGNSFHSFLIRAFEMYLRDGNAYIYVTAPPPVDKENPTLADVNGRRPYWALYTAAQLINHRYTNINGREVLEQCTLEEKTLEPDGLYGEREVTRHRILKRGSYMVERKTDADAKYFVEVEEQSTGLDEIPLVSMAEIGAVPPLLVLAMLNQLYYNVVSDFDSWIHLACVPNQVLKFDSSEEAKKYKELNKSPGVATMIYGEHADMFYVEVTGNGLEVAHNRIVELKGEMAEIGVGLLAPTEIAPKTATETLDTAGKRQSKLARYARDFENAVEKALYFTAEQINAIRRPGTVDLSKAEDSALKLVTDFERLTFSPEQMAIFERINASGKLSDETFFEMLQNIVDFPATWTYAIERTRKSKEMAERDAIIMEDEETGQAVGAGR